MPRTGVTVPCALSCVPVRGLTPDCFRGDGMERNGIGKVKIVWIEGDEPHSIVATPQGEEDNFLKFLLRDGRTILLQKSMIIKLEEVSG